MERDDDIDQRKQFRKMPSYGPDWDAAIEFGINMAMLESNLAMTMEERFHQSCLATKQMYEMRAAYADLRAADE